MGKKRKKILIVEDEYLIALSTRLVLEEMGYNVEGIALSGEAAIRLHNDSAPDLVIMDISLRGSMDGIMTAREIQKKADVPVLFISGNIDESNLKRMEGLKNWNCLSKPSNDQALKQAIDLWLGTTGEGSA